MKNLAVLPEYWNTGVTVLLLAEIFHRAHAKGYKWLDFSLTSEKNPQTLAIATRMGAKIYKRYRFYKKSLD